MRSVAALDGFVNRALDGRQDELLGDSKRVAADHYVYALTDYREVDRTIALVRIST